MPNTVIWHAFIDESGRVEQRLDPPTLAAFVVATGHARYQVRTLRQRLALAAPAVPWPIHTTHARLPLNHAIWSHLAEHRHGDPFLAAHATVAIDTLRREAPFELKRLFADLDRKMEGDQDLIRRLGRTLQHHDPTTWSALEGYARRVETAVVDQLRYVVGPGTVADGAFVAATAEGRKGGNFDSAAAADLAPWVHALGALVRRIADLLLQHGGEHQLYIRPHVLDVRNTTLNANVRLRLSDVSAAIDRLTGRDHRSPRGHVQTLPGTIERYDRDAEAASVFADLLANRLRRHLATTKPLATVERQTHTRLQLPVTSGDHPPLSHLAAADTPQDHIERARRHLLDPVELQHGIPAIRTGVYGWAREQAITWGQTLDAEAP